MGVILIVKALVDFLQANSSINIVVADGGTNENISESLNAYVLVSELSNYGSARHANATTNTLLLYEPVFLKITKLI